MSDELIKQIQALKATVFLLEKRLAVIYRCFGRSRRALSALSVGIRVSDCLGSSKRLDF